MIRYLLISIFFLSTQHLHAKSPIERFLNDVATNAIDIKIVEAQKTASSLRNESDLGMFDLTASLGAAFTSSDDPPTSPFAAEKTLKRNYTASLSKQWQSGFATSLSYELLDNFTGFPTRTDQDYFNPDLTLTIKTSLLRDIFSSRYSSIPDRIQKNAEALNTEAKIEQKTILVGALVTLAEKLELQEDLNLQIALCDNIRAQKSKLGLKFKRGSVRRRDYLLSRQEANTCDVSLQTLRKRIKERREDLSVTYGIDPDAYKDIRVDTFFQEFRRLFESSDFAPGKVDFQKNDSLLALRSRLDAANAKQLELDALTKPDLSFEIQTGLSGLQSELGDAHKDIGDTNYKLFYGSVTLAFPFRTRSAEINAAANRMDTTVLNHRIDKLERERKSDFKRLRYALEQDLASYRNYKENVELSQNILKDARRDFNNGRIDFFALTEFQKSLIQSQQRLASLRREIVVQAVEYIDFFQYFDQFYGGRK